jgi:polygalacturonase
VTGKAQLRLLWLSLLLGAACNRSNPARTSDAGAGAPTCDVHEYGAVGDGTTLDTKALQAAIDACAGTGGIVLVHDGVFSTAMLQLRSALTLRIATGATIRGTQTESDYPDLHPPTNNTNLTNCRKALLYGESVHDLTIDGGGTIDGNGHSAQWTLPHAQNPEATRPMAIFTALSSNIVIHDVLVENSAMWSLVNLEAEHLTISNVTINSPAPGPTRDGIDIVDCHHVLVENVTVTSEDDSICIKSGSTKGVDDVTIRNSHVVQSLVANGLKLGTASYGSFTNITFQNIAVESVDKAAMAVESVDGANVSNIVFDGITVHDVGTPFFVLLGNRGSTPTGAPHKLGSIDSVSFTSISGDASKHTWGSAISGTVLADGTKLALGNIMFSDVNISYEGGVQSVPATPPEYQGQYPDPNLWGDLPSLAYFLRHANSVTLTNVKSAAARSDARPPIDQVDVTNFSMR